MVQISHLDSETRLAVLHVLRDVIRSRCHTIATPTRGTQGWMPADAGHLSRNDWDADIEDYRPFHPSWQRVMKDKRA